MISQFFINRPVFATVLSLVIVIVGGIAATGLPVGQYPDVVPPTISIQTVYPGASAQVVADTVTTPIEQEVNCVGFGIVGSELFQHAIVIEAHGSCEPM